MNISIKDSMFQWIGVSITTILIANTLWADTIHVPGDYTTIQEAINAASVGDTIVVGPGIYKESVIMKSGVSLLGSGPHRTSIISPDPDQNTLSTTSNAFVEGFTIAQEKPGIGIILNVVGISPIIRNNVITRIGGLRSGETGIIVRSSTALIEKNFIYNFEVGIFVNRSSPVIKNNIIKCWAGILGEGANIIVINNTIITLKLMGMWLTGGGTVQNNIVMSIQPTDAWGIGAIPDDFELAYNNQLNYARISLDGVGNISADPLFVELANDNYLLSENSPSKDTGNPDEQYNDLDGTRNDMGAFGGPTPISSVITIGIDKSVEISKQSGFPGDTVIVAVSMNNPIGLQGAEVQIEYDKSILVATDIQLTSTTENFTLTADYATEGQIYAKLDGTSEVTGGSGSILNIEFIVSDSVRSGDVTPIRFESVILLNGSDNAFALIKITDGLFVVNQGSEEGAYIYVDSQNSQTEDGSRVFPFNTIQEAMVSATSGDTIVVVGGEYAGPLLMKDGVFLRGAGALVTNIRGASEDPTITFNSILAGEISGFTIFGPTDLPDISPIMTVISSSPRITNNRFEKTIFDLLPAIEITNQSAPIIDHNAIIESGINSANSSPIIEYNYIEGSEVGSAALGLFNLSNAIVTNNEIISGQGERPAIFIENVTNSSVINNKILCGKNGGDCIIVDGTVKIDIFNNLIEDILDNANGIVIRNSTEVVLANNIINTGNIGLDEDFSEMRAYNNIITGAANYGITASAASVIDYNDVWNNTNNYYLITKGEHDISEDPIFIDLENHDYRLGAGSPAIDAGQPGIEYNDRDGTRNDMGIFGGPHADTTGIFQAGPVLYIPKISGAPGDTIEIQLVGSNVERMSNILGRLSFDSNVMSYLNMETADLTNAFSLTRETFSSKMIGFSLQSTTGLKNAEGTLVKIHFIISEGAEQNSATIIEFDFAAVLDDLAIPQTNLRVENGEVTITPVGVINENLTPLTYELSHNYPNPFNPVTMIEYSLPSPGKVSLIIYNLLGQEIGRLVDSEMPAGDHIATWNATNYASGIYFYRLQAGDYVETYKMVLLK